MLVINVINIIDYLGAGKEESVAEQTAATYDVYDPYMEEAVVEDEAGVPELPVDEYEMTGAIDGRYEIAMAICPEDRSGSYYYVTNSPGFPIYFNITNDDPDNLTLFETTNGRHTGTFRGRLIFSRMYIRYVGTFTNALNGRQMPFEVSGDTDDLIYMYNSFCPVE